METKKLVMDKKTFGSDLSINEKILMGVVRIAEDFKKTASNVFKSYGLTFAQYNVLRVLNSFEDGENTITNVGRIMVVTGANMTGLSKRLEKARYLDRKRDPNDERVTILSITPSGVQVLKDIEQEKENILASYVGELTQEEKRGFLGNLKTVMNQTKRG